MCKKELFHQELKMSKRIVMVAFLLFISVMSRQASAGLNQWTSIGPEGGYINTLAIDPINTNVIYTGTFSNGVFKSVDAGANWSPANASLTNLNVRTLVIDPSQSSVIYAGTDGGGVFKSMNGGANWSAINTGLTNLRVTTFAIDPQNANVLFVGTFMGGIFKSVDNGAHWASVNTGLTNFDVHTLIIDPLQSNVVYVLTRNDGVFKSVDGGLNWFAIDTGLTDLRTWALAIDTLNTNVLYVGIPYSGVFKSTDGGSHWNVVNSGLDVCAIAIDKLSPNIVYAATFYHGVFKSADGGANWINVNADPDLSLINTLVINPISTNILYTGTHKTGVLKSSDGGASWSHSNHGLTAIYARALAVDPSDTSILYVGTLMEGLLKSVDGGANWSPMNVGLTEDEIISIAIDPMNTNVLYVGMPSQGVFKSVDGGANWSRRNTGLSRPGYAGIGIIFDIAIDPVNSNVLYAASYFIGAFKSVDGGAHWTAMNFSTNELHVRAIAIDPINTNVLYAGTEHGAYKSVDGGATWTVLDIVIGETDLEVRDFAINPSNTNILYAALQSQGVFMSVDGGVNWSAINTGITDRHNVSRVELDMVRSNIVYTGTAFGGVYKSVDGGSHWSAVNNGLPNSYVADLVMNPLNTNVLYAGTDKGAFVIEFSSVPPVANAGPDQTVEATSPAGASVSLNGTASYDPDGTISTFSWTGDFGSASGAMPTVLLSLGTHTITLTVTDNEGLTGTNTTHVTVQDTKPPVILVPADIVAESPNGSSMQITYVVTASDAVDGAVAVACSPVSGSIFPVGASVVNCTASDTRGHISAAAFHIIVTMNPDRSGGGTVSPGAGGTITTPDGSVIISIPPGAVSSDTYISVAETGTSYELTSNLGNGFALYGVTIQPEGTIFSTPITITFTWPDANNDGTIDGTNIKEQNVIITKNNTAITGRCKDEPGPLNVAGAECSPASNYFKFKVSSLSVFAVVYIDDMGPLTSNVMTSPNPVPVNTSMTLTATVDDSLRGDSAIAAAEYTIDGVGYIPMNALDGVFNTVREDVIATIPAFAEPGVHALCVRGWDILRNTAGPEECIFLPVYDPTEGFVTGGGWIISPVGAYVLNPELVGKATFGFVSKYLKGAKTPSGTTEFQFKVANLNFHSDSYEWLVIAGAKAQYKGTGNINGMGTYGFMLTAIDGDVPGGGGIDKFRIKIWDKESNTIIYDNQLSQDDTAVPSTSVVGGSIVIHKK
jgi:photosystem II stability/assembly factor-like uncharacterized protein